MATTRYGPVLGRTYSISSMLTGDAAATITSTGLLGPSDQTKVTVNNVTNGATATLFTISELQLDGNSRVITTLSGNASASVTVPTAVPVVNATGLLITLPGPIGPVTVTLGGAAPTGNIYVEIDETTWRPQ